MATELQQKYEELLPGENTYASFDAQIGDVVLDSRKHGMQWYGWLGVGFLGTNILLISITWLLLKGIGIWGNNQPAAWGFDIINFVWWIGIGHAGTLISAILLLLKQQWRNSINRFAEAMTVFAVMCAGLFPLLHTGRPWLAYWMFPYPNILGMWPNFRSPLIWDVFAVSTYFTVSALFWFIGLIPDFAMLRDKARNAVVKPIYGMLALGWRGSARHWSRYEQAYMILAGLSTPLVLSVHSIVSFDFAVSIVPGWNVTLFPPYFVAGAVFAGFAMVLTFAIPMRRWYKLENLITMKHIDWCCKIMLATGMIVAYGYAMELYYSFYSQSPYEMALTENRLYGPYRWAYYALIFCNAVAPLPLWSRKMRQNLPFVMGVCFVVSIGMWLERFVIIPMSLTRDYLPSSWGVYVPSAWDYLMYGGTIGFFIFMMFLFMRFLPVINSFEMKELLHRKKHAAHNHPVEAAAGEGGH